MSGTELVTNAAADPLRIVLVAPPYFDIPPKGYGGTEVVVADLADALVKRGHDVTVLGAGEPRTSARLIPVWERTLADRLGEPYPEIMHALKVRRVIERIATTDGVDIVHDHTFAGPLNTPAYSAVGIPMVVTVHGPIDDDLYPYYRVLGDEVGLIAISDRQRELAPDLNWVDRVHNALRIDEWPFRADKGDYALFLGRYAPYKGAHLALCAAHQAGIPLVLAGKCNEPPEQAYFSRFLMVRSSASPMRISMCHCPGSAGRWKAQWSMPSLKRCVQPLPIFTGIDDNAASVPQVACGALAMDP